MHEWNPGAELVRPQMNLADKQPRRLRIALVLLLVALAVVIVKDRDFWFGGDELAQSDAVVPESAPKATPAAAKVSQAPVAPVATAKKHVAARTSSGPSVAQPAQQEATNSDTPAVSTKRTVLPPLDVEVVAGDTHRTIHPGSNVTKVEIPSGSNSVSAVSASMASLPTNAAERESLTAGAVPELRQTIDNLPLLGQHMRVQGSVVLQAVVSADGIIEDLRVLSGPAVLTTAAQQAVRQWRFKPVLQNGQPVETKATITVNFSIRVSDSPAKTT
jgi:protein TonB